MRIKLVCCCGATIDVEEEFAPHARAMADSWLERHKDCRPAPANPGYIPTGPVYVPGPVAPDWAVIPPDSPPWEVTCGVRGA